MKAQSETLLGVFSTFKDTISIALSDAFQPVIPQIKDTLKEITPIIGQAVKVLAPSLGQLLTALGPLLASGLSLAAPILGKIVDILSILLTTLEPAFGPLAAAFDSILTALTPLIVVLGGVLTETIINALVPALLELIPVINELVPSLIVLATAFIPLIPPLGQLAAAIISLLVPIAQLLTWLISLGLEHNNIAEITAILVFLTDAIRGLGEWLSNVDWGGIWAAIVNFFSSGVRGVTGWLTRLSQSVHDKAQEVIGFVKALPGRILSALGNLGSLLFGAGADLVRGLWNGVSSLGSWLYSKVKSFVYDNTLGAAKRLLGISSPSKAFEMEVGREIPAGIERGVLAGLSDLQTLLSPIVPSGGVSAASNSGASTTNLGGITLNVMFSGVAPTETEARRARRGGTAGASCARCSMARSTGFDVATSPWL